MLWHLCYFQVVLNDAVTIQSVALNDAVTVRSVALNDAVTVRSVDSQSVAHLM